MSPFQIRNFGNAPFCSDNHRSWPETSRFYFMGDICPERVIARELDPSSRKFYLNENKVHFARIRDKT